MKEERKDIIIITDALNGKNITNIDCSLWSDYMVIEMIKEIITFDYNDYQHGILIKYGIKS